METSDRQRRASPPPVLGLTEFLAAFQDHFGRRESREALERYLRGLLEESSDKSCNAIAAVIPDTSEQCLQGLLTNMVWDEQALNQQRIRLLGGSSTGGTLLLTEFCFVKQGRHSVGVARQYSTALGKVANCQVVVHCHYASRAQSWPIAARLYLPKEWAENEQRRRKGRVPQTIPFQTRQEIALSLVDEARACRVQHDCVIAAGNPDAAPDFLASLQSRQERCIVEVPSDFRVQLTRQSGEPDQKAEAVLADLPPEEWRTFRWHEGSQRHTRARFAALRCWRLSGDGTHRGWLIGRCLEPGRDGERDYYWSNFESQVDLGQMVEYLRRLRRAEEYRESATRELGLDQYQGRLWPGFHRHLVAVMLGYSFRKCWGLDATR